MYLLRTRSGVADFVKLLDFGISKFNQLSGDSGFSMTRTGAVMGTPYYMAPEQAKGAKDADHRVDLYAAGVILYESVTGEVPFNADTFNELLFKIVLEEPRPVQLLDAADRSRFAAIINKAMTRDPAARFQTAKEFQLALEQWATHSGPELSQALPGAAAGRASIADGTGQFTPSARSGWSARHGHGWHLGPTPGASALNRQRLGSRARRGLIVVLGALGLLLIGGGVLGMRVLSGAPAAAPAAVAPQANAAEEKAKTEALMVAAKAQQQEVDAKAEAERNAEAAKQAAAQAAANAAPAPAPTPSAAVAAIKPKAAVSRAVARPAPAAVAAKEPPKAAPAPASTGRKIRTSL